MTSACGLCERELRGDAAAYLCPGCTRGTVERLGRMPALYVTLAVFLAPSRGRGGSSRVRRVEAPLPVSEIVLSLRGPGGIVGLLEDWRSALHADLGWGEPAVRGTVHERVVEAAARLTDNMLWIASSWPLAGAFAEELRDQEREVLSVVSPAEKTRRIGKCPTRQLDGSQCGAILRAPVEATEARCSWCNTLYPLHSWYEIVRADREERPAA